MVAIKTDGLTKQYNETTAVADFDLSVERGEVFGFLGPNGAGKSTVIDLLLDFRQPTAGRISVLGYNPQKNPYAVRQRVGVLPEDYCLYDRLTGREHLEFAIKMHGSDDDPDTILERVGLDDDDEQLASNYSKGMSQRLALGMSLVGDPAILILDEPSAGLDPHGMREFQQTVREEADSGTTVFFSSHLLEQVEAVCDRVGIIDNGELITVNTVEELRETIGGRSTLVLTVDTIPNDHGLLDLDNVTNVESSDNTLRVDCTDPNVKSPVINRVEAAGATVIDIDVENTSLEELFSEVTAGGDTI